MVAQADLLRDFVALTEFRCPIFAFVGGIPSGLLTLSIQLRTAIVFAAAILVSRFVNWAIYRWAYNKSDFGPWAKPPGGLPAHNWIDHAPILGWWRLRRESQALDNKIFWVRPLALEAIFPCAIAWYYQFYTTGGALGSQPAATSLQPSLHSQFVGHFVLLTLMTIATFIDFDEFSIPDMVTVPGTIIGILGALLMSAWLPFHALMTPNGSIFGHEELQAVQPTVPPWMHGPWGLTIAIAIIAVWGFALLERRWITRQGIRNAVRYFFARLTRNKSVWLPVLVVCVVLIGVVVVAWALSAGRWPFLISSLLGLAFAGGVTWAVRLAASWALRVEALGFGDVTLMAMIGSYVGWQASLLIFFLAPLVAFAIVLVRAILTGETATPYGPYLCGGAVIVLVFWESIWVYWAAPLFALGNVILAIVTGCILMLGAMLWIWRLIKQALGIKTF